MERSNQRPPNCRLKTLAGIQAAGGSHATGIVADYLAVVRVSGFILRVGLPGVCRFRFP